MELEDDTVELINIKTIPYYIPTALDYIVYAHNKRYGFIQGDAANVKKMSEVVKIVRQHFVVNEGKPSIQYDMLLTKEDSDG